MTARDPGLQPERTRLAWRRTTLACTVATVLAGRAALQGGADVAGILAAVLCVLMWLGFLRVAHHRISALGEAAAPRPMVPRLASAAALCTVALAACGVVLVR